MIHVAIKTEHENRCRKATQTRRSGQARELVQLNGYGMNVFNENTVQRHGRDHLHIITEDHCGEESLPKKVLQKCDLVYDKTR